jgi:hypothetical protein
MASTAALLVGLAALAFLDFRETAPPEQTLRYSIVPEADAFDFFAISPNGRSLVTSAWGEGQAAALAPADGCASGSAYPVYRRRLLPVLVAG